MKKSGGIVPPNLVKENIFSMTSLNFFPFIYGSRPKAVIIFLQHRQEDRMA
jgi:hypothetical protein